MNVDPTGMEEERQVADPVKPAGAKSSGPNPSRGGSSDNTMDWVNEQTGTFISQRVIATTLTIRDGGSGDYNATYTLTQTISTMSQIPGTNDRIESLSTQVLATGDMRTVPDNPGNGSPTLNGDYSWVNHPHNGGFPTAQVRNPDRSGTLPTTGLNPNNGTFRQDGINIHPPNPNSSRVWKDPGVSLGSSTPRPKPFSKGCWQPRPDANGKALIDGMRNAQGSRLIRLNTSWNEGRTFD